MMEPDDQVRCSICTQTVPNNIALHVDMSRVDDVWLCPSCVSAVLLDSLASFRHRRAEPPGNCAICHRLEWLKDALTGVLRPDALRIEMSPRATFSRLPGRDPATPIDDVWLCRSRHYAVTRATKADNSR
jgi:hypothetical protein